MTAPVLPVDQIHAEVRDHYAQRVQAATSCCGPDNCCSPTVSLYAGEELNLLPLDETPSFGCGNPTAIAALNPGETVLDLGSGAGLDVMLAARKVGPTGFVYGVDMTDEMLAAARRNAAKAGVPNVKFRKGHIEAIPLPDASVDVIISNCVINLSPDKGQTLHEAYRVLKPGGRLAVSDIVVDGTLDDLPVSEDQIRTALSWAGCIAGALTVADYRQLLLASGFRTVDVVISHRYSVEELGQDLNDGPIDLPRAVAEELVNRFASAYITALR